MNLIGTDEVLIFAKNINSSSNYYKHRYAIGGISVLFLLLVTQLQSPYS